MQDGSDSEDAVDSDDEPPPPDHSDYHGRGWQPSQAQPKALEGAAGDAVSSASAAAVTGQMFLHCGLLTACSRLRSAPTQPRCIAHA